MIFTVTSVRADKKAKSSCSHAVVSKCHSIPPDILSCVPVPNSPTWPHVTRLPHMVGNSSEMWLKMDSHVVGAQAELRIGIIYLKTFIHLWIQG